MLDHRELGYSEVCEARLFSYYLPRKSRICSKIYQKVKTNPVVVDFDFTLANLMSIILNPLDIHLFLDRFSS
jgi:hypothetical protein